MGYGVAVFHPFFPHSPWNTLGRRAGQSFPRQRPLLARELCLLPAGPGLTPCLFRQRARPTSLQTPRGEGSQCGRERKSTRERTRGNHLGDFTSLLGGGARRSGVLWRGRDGHSSGSSGHPAAQGLSSLFPPFPIWPHRAGCRFPPVCRLLRPADTRRLLEDPVWGPSSSLGVALPTLNKPDR